MTNSISSDGILTKSPVANGKNPARQADARSADTGKTVPSAQANADVNRAQQRLTQEAVIGESVVPDSPVQAKALAEAVSQRLAADPQGALRANRLVSGTLFEAATARPTA